MQPWHRDSSRSSFQFHEPWLSYFLVSKLMNSFVALQSTLYYPGYTKLCFGNKQLPNLSSFTQQRCTCHSTRYALQVGCGLRLSQTLRDIGCWRLYPNNHHSSGKGTWQSTLAVNLSLLFTCHQPKQVMSPCLISKREYNPTTCQKEVYTRIF